MESMMTARQVAELLGVHENWVYDRAASGGLPSYKLGGASSASCSSWSALLSIGCSVKGRSKPQAWMISIRLSIGGEIAPCSQRAITERSRPVRSESSVWLRPARVRASRISSPPRIPEVYSATASRINTTVGLIFAIVCILIREGAASWSR